MVKGTPRFDGLAIGEMTVSFLTNLLSRKEGDPPAISVKAAFIESKEGTTHGFTYGGAKHGGPKWSARVFEKAEELRLLLEEELARLHLDGLPTEGEEEAEGLGEFAAGSREAPQG